MGRSVLHIYVNVKVRSDFTRKFTPLRQIQEKGLH